MVHRWHLVHIKRRERERVAWCGARPAGFAASLDHAAVIATDDDLQACPRCAVAAAAAVLAGARFEQVSAA